ncbi:uncharacterized protein LOC141899097 [Tubulanus polymorphus]|uniref:uncharacterized protein LOC141899097 n=1 Tax=Tubulanus polymorphus TaxID=672921 RepID=UPI003DA6CBDF
MLKHVKIKRKVPVTPPMESSISGLVEEYNCSPLPPRPKNLYCQQLSETQYEHQASTETEKALKELVETLEKNPDMYKQLLKKRKQERMEKSGIFTYIKMKFQQFIQGTKYKGPQVTDSECWIQLYALKAGMLEAFEYSQEFRNLRNKREGKKTLTSNQAENRLSLLTSTPRFPPAIKRTMETEHKSSNLIKKATPLRMPQPPKLNISVCADKPPSELFVLPQTYKAPNLTRPPLRDCNRIPRVERRQNKRLLPSLAPFCKKTKLDDAQVLESHQENHVRFKQHVKSPGSTPFKRMNCKNQTQDSMMTYNSLNMSLEASLCQAFGEIMQRESIRRVQKSEVKTNSTDDSDVDQSNTDGGSNQSTNSDSGISNQSNSDSGISNQSTNSDSGLSYQSNTFVRPECINDTTCSSIRSGIFKSKYSFRDHLNLGNPVDSSFYQVSGSDSMFSYSEWQV